LTRKNKKIPNHYIKYQTQETKSLNDLECRVTRDQMSRENVTWEGDMESDRESDIESDISCDVDGEILEPNSSSRKIEIM